MTDNERFMLSPQNRKNLVFLVPLLFLLSVFTPNSLSNPAKRVLEKEIQDWLVSQGASTDTLVIQVNDSRLSVPLCEHKFQISPSNNTVAPIIRIVKASCPGSNWSRLIRIKSKIKATESTRERYAPEKTTVLVTTQPIMQYARVTRDQLVEKEVSNSRLLTNVVEKSKTLESYYARRPLRKGQIITESDLISPKKLVVVKSSVPAQSIIKKHYFSLEYRLKQIPKDAVVSLEGLEKLATNRLLHPGDILRKRDLTQAKLVKRGDLVLVEAKTSDFQIVSEAIAFQDGYLGEQIKLTSLDSKRKIKATVVGQGKVSALSKKWITK